ncbi:efflux RND transporter periplasmic adaptor subunit [Ruegeria halocynthiae]|uniref:efflux RND transporter periplasmic adaptor subunit n=1 Tax=Ruegeria halocynthiae TaxID=985054 RepID=UPI0013643250|nr:efflux RND transporter periplasmic adaptor subunit [Ruegeria halocynthiae]
MKFRCLPDLVGALALTFVIASAAHAQDVVRGLKTVLIEETSATMQLNYPSVLVPADISTLSFETGGKLGQVRLNVGQVVRKGDVLAELEKTSFNLNVSQAESQIRQAEAEARNTADALERQQTLFERGSTTKVALENAETAKTSADAGLAQARSALKLAQEELRKTTLVAPFDGILNTVNVDSFNNVNQGAPVATIYKTDAFEVKFTINFDVLNVITLGQPAKVRLAARPSTVLEGTITEIGARADRVSSFPVVVSIADAPADVRAGMAAEASLEITLSEAPGYSIPLSALAESSKFEQGALETDPVSAEVYVFDESESTVKKHKILIVGVRDNKLLVSEGLEPGMRVASAGVPFLREGMRVKLLADK